MSEFPGNPKGGPNADRGSIRRQQAALASFAFFSAQLWLGSTPTRSSRPWLISLACGLHAVVSISLGRAPPDSPSHPCQRWTSVCCVQAYVSSWLARAHTLAQHTHLHSTHMPAIDWSLYGRVVVQSELIEFILQESLELRSPPPPHTHTTFDISVALVGSGERDRWTPLGKSPRWIVPARLPMLPRA